uniref:Uncharacterized protein n=1 Tax=Magallana gigas TaxID=29159 RepID=K1P7U1_MAGGI
MKWCKYLQDPENYKPKHLPYGKYLTGEDFRNDLQHVFSELAKDATKLSNLGSTQANENFNRIVACKNPKMCYLVDQRAHLFVWQLLLPTRILEIRPLKK